MSRINREMEHEIVQAKRNQVEAILAINQGDATEHAYRVADGYREVPAGPTDIPGAATIRGITKDMRSPTRSLNALRHGLTGQTVLMPWEDREAYDAFCRDFLADLAPAGFEQTQLAQTVVDCQWRLNRASAYESAILSYRAYMADQCIHDDTAIEGEMAKARAFPLTQRDILNISIYESRIQRKMMNARKSLRELKKEQREALAQEGVAAQPQPPVPAQVAPAVAAAGARSPIPDPRPPRVESPVDFVFSDLETFCAPPPAPERSSPSPQSPIPALKTLNLPK